MRGQSDCAVNRCPVRRQHPWEGFRCSLPPPSAPPPPPAAPSPRASRLPRGVARQATCARSGTPLTSCKYRLGAMRSDIGAVAAPGRERRMTASHKREPVLQLVQGEPLELVARELGDGGRPERLARRLPRRRLCEPEIGAPGCARRDDRPAADQGRRADHGRRACADEDRAAGGGRRAFGGAGISGTPSPPNEFVGIRSCCRKKAPMKTAL